MLDSDTSFVPDFQDPAALQLPAAEAESQAAETEPATAQRPVTPRRPLRFSAARIEEPTRAAIAVPDIFDGIFDEERPTTDPRLQRGRARALALLAVQETRLSPSERNLWHDDEVEPQQQQDRKPAATTPPPQDDAPRAGRRVRHLTVADLSPQRPATAAMVQDQLRDQLHAVRAALYDPLPESEYAPPAPTLPERLMAATFNLILLVVAFPLGLALTALSLLRGEDLRLSAHAMAIAGLVAAILNQPPFPLL